MNEADQLDAIFPSVSHTKEVLLTSVRGADGKPVIIDVQPIRVGKLAAFMRAVNGLLAAFSEPEKLDMAVLVMNHTDEVIVGLAVALDVDREMIEALDLADLVITLTAVVEVNADFFTHRLQPAIERARGTIATLRGPSSASA